VGAKDRLYAAGGDGLGSFVFDDRVVRVFPDMIRRSVPGYPLIVPLTALLARRYARDGSRLYDLGCSLGAVSLAMSEAVAAREAEIVAVDRAPAMIEGLQRVLQARKQPGTVPIRPLCQDVLETPIENASVVVLNFTLQFIPSRRRLPLLRRIAAGLQPSGVLLLSEKIRFADPQEQRLQTEWHHDFKRAQGYSDLEIARKRDALEKVMQPDTLAQHRRRLSRAGFSASWTWFQAFGFAAVLAVR
jgi:tRNA (cmo5U34)-methyltransferase